MEVYCIINETKTIEAPTQKIDLSEPLAYNNSLAHAFRVTIHNDDESEADLTGIGVTGTFLKANNETVDPIIGTIIDGEGGNPCVAQVILPPSCYVTPGRFKFTMTMTKVGGYVRTIQWVEGRVEKNTSGTIIDPGTPVTNYSTIIANANAAAEAAEEAAESVPEVQSAIAPTFTEIMATNPFVPLGAYEQHCWYNDQLYVNKVDINSSEAWNTSHWEAVDISGELYRIQQLSHGITPDTNGIIITI